MPRRGALAADLEHVGIDVADGGAKAGARRLGGAERDVAGAAGDVEQRERRVAPRRIERVDHDVLPDPVQAHRHQIVHQVVARRHAVKHVVHQRLLVAQGDVPEAEMRGLVRPIHQLYSTARPDHSAPAAMSLSRHLHKVNDLKVNDRHARITRSRDRPPRPAAGHGGREDRESGSPAQGPAVSVPEGLCRAA